MGHSDISVTAKIYTHMADEVFEQNRMRMAQYAVTKSQQVEQRTDVKKEKDSRKINSTILQILQQHLLYQDHFCFAYLIRFSSSYNIKCTGCKIDKELTEFSLTHIIPYNIIKQIYRL